MQDLNFDIHSLHTAYAEGLSSADVIKEVYRRIERVDDPGIFIHLLEPQQVLHQAAELSCFDAKLKPLWGLPFVIKDNIDLADTPTTAACPAYSYQASKDAFVVAQLRQAGALCIGKTNLDQFATGLVGVRSPYPPPKNAINPKLVPGGSSSGSAVAVAQGLVSFALGTDTAGSGRVPAALNNIVGLKPTLGAISNSGVVPACRTLDTVSIFALTATDAYRVLQTAAQYDSHDAYAKTITTPPLALSTRPAILKVGIPDVETREFFGDQTQAETFTTALGQLQTLAIDLVEIDFKLFFQAANMLYEGVWVAERLTVVEDLLRSQPESLHPVTRQIISAAEQFSPADVFRGFYQLAELKRQIKPLIDSVDMLCVPSVPTFYSVLDLQMDPITPNSRLGIYTNFVNLLDLCGIAVPTQPRTDALPGSVTLLARAGCDAQIAAVANQLQCHSGIKLGATDWSPSMPDLCKSDQAKSHEIALAVVGAHLSGLPLNHELTRLGARFLRSTHTAACYRLYHLTGGPPERPGLVRSTDGGGGSIAIEIWAMPVDQFGTFVKDIPEPLGIGTLTLEDNSKVKGFICENCGLQGAIDITAYGGWRHYLDSTR